MNAEGPVRIECGAGGPRVLRDQLEITERRDQGDHEGHHEREPRGAADLLGDLTGERVDPGTENVTDDKQEQQPRSHHAMKARLDDRGRTGVTRRNTAHRVSSAKENPAQLE